MRSAISEMASLLDHELIQWWQAGGRQTSVTEFDSYEYRALTQHCHQSVIVELSQIHRGVRLEPVRSASVNVSSSQNLSRRICAAVSQGFGSSIRSVCAGEDLSIDQAKARANKSVTRVVIKVCCGECSVHSGHDIG